MLGWGDLQGFIAAENMHCRNFFFSGWVGFFFFPKQEKMHQSHV